MERLQPNFYISPFCATTLKHMIENWLEQTEYVGSGRKNKDIPYDEDDSYSVMCGDFRDLLAQLNEQGW